MAKVLFLCVIGGGGQEQMPNGNIVKFRINNLTGCAFSYDAVSVHVVENQQW